MSNGDQIRDYSSIEQMINKLYNLTMNSKINGIFNCCSGQGTKIIDLVTSHINLRNSKIKLNLGYYPYNNYEPLDFWGDNTKWNSIFE
jgi:dTDP-6-deoxy-L-talose 4-dehydrogenase (NAD+)